MSLYKKKDTKLQLVVSSALYQKASEWWKLKCFMLEGKS